MRRPSLFVELCAGLASVSLALQGGRHARPPVSRMGAKTGYAPAILGALGLRCGLGSDAYLWCEPDPGVRSVLACYPDPDKLRAVAATIRGWAGEEPRALWGRLRAQGPTAGVPGWLWVQVRTIGGQPIESNGHGYRTCGFKAEGAMSQDGLAANLGELADARWPSAAARWLAVTAGATGGDGGFKGSHVRRPNVDGFIPSRGGLADGAEALAGLDLGRVLIADDARAVDPAAVARWLILATWAYRKGEPASGYNASAVEGRATTATDHGAGARDAATEAALVERGLGIAWPDGAVAADARDPEPPPGLDGVYAYIDPPYQGTTPYAHALGRDEVVALARRWSAAGAVVAVSEAEPLDLGEGWHAVEITCARRGRRRTFSRQQREWLTMNREPAARVAVQVPMLAAVARAT